MSNSNLKFDEVEGEDILEAFDFEAKGSEPKVEQKVEAKPVVEAKTDGNTVTISANQFSDLLNMVKGLTAEIATLKAGKPTKVKDEKPAAGTAEKPKRTREQYISEMKERNKGIAAERLASCISRSGKSEAEVKKAFAEAHKYANTDQTAYKARFDEELVRLIGVKKYAVAV